MKSLIAIATLGLALALPTLSWAFVPQDHFRLQYGTPTTESAAINAQSEAGINVLGVELRDRSTKAANKTAKSSEEDTGQKKEYIMVFGVQVPTGRKA